MSKLVERIKKLGRERRHALLKRLLPDQIAMDTVELDDPSIWAHVLWPHILFISNRNLMNVPFTFESACRKAEKCVLLNSGATENFMDQRMVS
jgi:hypothetical protein